MTPLEISGQELARQLGFTDDEGQVSVAGLADHLRRGAGRWGPSSRARLAGHLRYTLTGCGLHPPDHLELIRLATATLLQLGELVDLGESGDDEADDDADDLPVDEPDEPTPARRPVRRVVLAAPSPRLVRFGDAALVLGALERADARLQRFGGATHAAVARWASDPALVEDLAADCDDLSPEEWLGLPGAVHHLERRTGAPKVVGADGGLSALWGALLRDLEEFGRPMDDARGLTVLTGAPGAFFGSHRGPSGRWRTLRDAPDGTWPALLRRERREDRPLLIGVLEGRVAKGLDLFDGDELRWSILARAAHAGAPEVVRLHEPDDGVTAELTCWVPAQLERLRAIAVADGWRWRFPPWVPAEPIREAFASVGLSTSG